MINVGRCWHLWLITEGKVFLCTAYGLYRINCPICRKIFYETMKEKLSNILQMIMWKARAEMTDVETVGTDFAATGRTGRRNAMPDILGSNAGPEVEDLPNKLADLTVGGTVPLLSHRCFWKLEKKRLRYDRQFTKHVFFLSLVFFLLSLKSQIYINVLTLYVIVSVQLQDLYGRC